MSHENDNKAFENGFMSLAVWGLNFTQKQIKFGTIMVKGDHKTYLSRGHKLAE